MWGGGGSGGGGGQTKINSVLKTFDLKICVSPLTLSIETDRVDPDQTPQNVLSGSTLPLIQQLWKHQQKVKWIYKF